MSNSDPGFLSIKCPLAIKHMDFFRLGIVGSGFGNYLTPGRSTVALVMHSQSLAGWILMDLGANLEKQPSGLGGFFRQRI